ncbi:MAG: hypothetical protein WBA74_22285 [Cyclobacteriaceae bacterium]
MLLALAIAVGLLFHGASFFNTLEDTYDFYVHSFFADHYARSWFEPWEPRWYTGFSMMSYPPLVHQLIALLSFIGGIRFGAFLVAFGIIVLFVTGAYRFSRIFTINSESAGYASLVAVFCPSVVEALHVFGQLPTMMGISWLLHAIPEIYLYIRWGRIRYFINALSILAVAVASHHVTPIFGMVFFVLPVMATAVMDGAKDQVGTYKAITIKVFINFVFKYLKRIILVGLSSIVVTVLVILPYWILTKNDPIAQVPIPHGSRDSFIDVFSSGLVFFIIPWGFFIVFLPFVFYRIYSKRNIFLGLSFSLLVLLGTGGTTPLPKLILGENAFSILTLERFTFWATIMSIPFVAEFLWRYFEGNIYKRFVKRFSLAGYKIITAVMILMIFISSGFTMNLGFFRPTQPDPVEMEPIVNFLNSDKHSKWRFLTLGFGDQMALLSAKTNALTIDGNYHSARRIPELTTRAIERLENSKYRGVEGIGTLQQFLAAPELFHLKYVFSNDKFYDPLLFYSGWHRVKLMTNGIMVWERADVSPLPSVLPEKRFPRYQKIWWGLAPLIVLTLAFIINIQLHWVHHMSGKNVKRDSYKSPEKILDKIHNSFYAILKVWVIGVIVVACIVIANLYFLNQKQTSPERVVASYYDAIDFKKFTVAHSYLIPEEDLSIEQFLLEISVTDGLVESYGKLNSIITEVISRTDSTATVSTQLEWITAIKSYQRNTIHQVKKIEGKWFLAHLPFENQLPTNQFDNRAEISFYNQGRRNVTTKESFHEDVLDRPVVRVVNSSLVKADDRYAVIGTIQNLDDYPADLTVKASLFDADSNLLTSYYDKFHIIHKLLPKQVTPFRIDFEGVGWRIDTTTSVFDPDAFETFRMQNPPVMFTLEVLSNVTTRDLKNTLAINELDFDGKQLSGALFNYGHQAATITQFLTGYYTSDDNLIWVDQYFMPKGVFPGKYEFFSYETQLPESLIIIRDQSESTLVNGLDNLSLSSKYRNADNSETYALIPQVSSDMHTVSVHLNPYTAGSF